MRKVAVPGALAREPGRHAAGDRGRPGRRVEPLGGRRLRPGHLGGQHGRAVARAGRRRRPAHPGGPRRGRLAGRRGPAHRLRAGRAAGRLRQGRCGGRRARGPSAPRRAAGRRQGRGAGGPDALRRRAADPLAARPRRGDPLPRAVHADRARPGAGHRRGLGQGVRRLDGAGRVPRRDGRRAIRVQPAGRDRGAADARRVRRAVLRLGRDAVRPASPGPVAGPRGRHAGRDPAGQAAGGAGHRADARPAAAHGGLGRRRAGPDRRVLVHPRRRRPGRWGSSTTRPSTRSSPRPSSRSRSTRCIYRLARPIEAVLRRFIGEPAGAGSPRRPPDRPATRPSATSPTATAS